MEPILFSDYIPSKEDDLLEKEQKPVLTKLEEQGYGLYIEKDFYVPIPCFFNSSHFPVKLYDSRKDEIVVATNFEEIASLVTT